MSHFAAFELTRFAAIDISAALVSSAVVAAIVGGLSSFVTQRYLLDRKAKVDYEFMARKRLNEAIGPLACSSCYVLSPWRTSLRGK